ncbi:unnamed protein product [Amoebophrya sp. A120]|nr:unnamed protein product [Amoebophrya sp. A120]|eukprot:GSA120T00020522001.1
MELRSCVQIKSDNKHNELDGVATFQFDAIYQIYLRQFANACRAIEFYSHAFYEIIRKVARSLKICRVCKRVRRAKKMPPKGKAVQWADLPPHRPSLSFSSPAHDAFKTAVGGKQQINDTDLLKTARAGDTSSANEDENHTKSAGQTNTAGSASAAPAALPGAREAKKTSSEDEPHKNLTSATENPQVQKNKNVKNSKGKQQIKQLSHAELQKRYAAGQMSTKAVAKHLHEQEPGAASSTAKNNDEKHAELKKDMYYTTSNQQSPKAAPLIVLSSSSDELGLGGLNTAAVNKKHQRGELKTEHVLKWSKERYKKVEVHTNEELDGVFWPSSHIMLRMFAFVYEQEFLFYFPSGSGSRSSLRVRQSTEKSKSFDGIALKFQYTQRFCA